MEQNTKTMTISPKPLKPSITTMEETQTLTQNSQGSHYFPGCRKDANCNCIICLESINATLDLMPMSVHKSTLTKLSFSNPKPILPITPISIDPTLLSTPTSKPPPPTPTPRSRVRTPEALKSTARTITRPPFEIQQKKGKTDHGLRIFWWVLILVGLVLVLGLEFGVSKGVAWGLRPKLSAELVGNVAEIASILDCSLKEKLAVVQQHLEGVLVGNVSSCHLGDSSWAINQDGLILASQCILYQSAAEEVIIWGWPLQTAGILTAGLSARSLTVLSGRVTEWPEGKIASVIREVNSTWVLRKWNTSAVQFDADTWIIEYKQSLFLENPSVFSAVAECYKIRISRFIKKLKLRFWVLSDLTGHHSSSESGVPVPT